MMRLGIILPCNNIEKSIDVQTVLSFIDCNLQCCFCFVNNGSTDDTQTVLEYLMRESINEIYVLDIKKNKNELNVAKIGARFLNAKKEFDRIQYLPLDFELNKEELNLILDTIKLNKYKFLENNKNSFM